MSVPVLVKAMLNWWLALMTWKADRTLVESIEGGCRAHRSPAAKPNLGQRPWPVIIRLYRYQIKDLLIREAQRRGKLQYHYQQREGMASLSRWREGLCGQPIHCICIILSIYVMLLTTSVTLSFAAVCRRLDSQMLHRYLAAMVTGRLFSSGFKYLLMSALCIFVYIHARIGTAFIWLFSFSLFNTLCIW